MYKIIGGDGKEYGPISADQIKTWLAEGRVNLQTRGQVVGSTDWKTLADFPEFQTMVPPPLPSKPRLSDESDELSTGDWVVCALCSGIGCILGIIRLIQGKPNAGKMIGWSILFAVIWTILRVIIIAGTASSRY